MDMDMDKGRFQPYLETGEFCDTLLLVGNNKTEVKAHKLILMMTSDFFYKEINDFLKANENQGPNSTAPDLIGTGLELAAPPLPDDLSQSQLSQQSKEEEEAEFHSGSDSSDPGIYLDCDSSNDIEGRPEPGPEPIHLASPEVSWVGSGEPGRMPTAAVGGGGMGMVEETKTLNIVVDTETDEENNSDSEDLVLISYCPKEGYEIQVEIPFLNTNETKLFLDFLYSGGQALTPLNTNFRNSLSLFRVAHEVEDYQLAFYTSDLLKHYNDTKFENSLGVFDMSTKYQDKELQDLSLDTICRNADILVDHPDFLQFELRHLDILLAEDGLQVKSEIQLFKALMKWAKEECKRWYLNPDSQTDLKSVMDSLLHHIRFPVMSGEDLSREVGKTHVLDDNEMVELFTHVFLPKDQKNKIDTVGRFKTKPRNYKQEFNAAAEIPIDETINLRPCNAVGGIGSPITGTLTQLTLVQHLRDLRRRHNENKLPSHVQCGIRDAPPYPAARPLAQASVPPPPPSSGSRGLLTFGEWGIAELGNGSRSRCTSTTEIPWFKSPPGSASAVQQQQQQVNVNDDYADENELVSSFYRYPIPNIYQGDSKSAK